MDEQIRWVYFWKDVQPEAVQLREVVTYDIWHQRLSYPSKQVMFLFSNSMRSYDSKSSSDIGEMCFKAKQTITIPS